MIRRCGAGDVDTILAVINDGAEAYRGKIPGDRWNEPYMPAAELEDELAAGVVFWAYVQDQEITAVMGLQEVQDVTLVRHAYTRTAHQGRGLGSALLDQLRAQTARPMLIGTWKAATWAVRFYEHHGFRLVSEEEKRTLLKRYWTVPERQIQESVVLADDRWRALVG
jgi:GNAT superfamily N-acetyltransferase